MKLEVDRARKRRENREKKQEEQKNALACPEFAAEKPDHSL